MRRKHNGMRGSTGTLAGILERQTIMNWTDLKNKIYHWDGTWRDIYVLHTSRVDWKKWADYVNNNYRIDWFNGKTDKDENQIDFSVIEEFWSGNHDLCSTAKVFIDKIQINAHFFDDTELENDIDPREFNSIDDHDKLVKYMTDLSKLLGKEVILTPENEHETILFKISNDKIEFSENIAPTLFAVTSTVPSLGRHCEPVKQSPPFRTG